jgi:hypothetical protein
MFLQYITAFIYHLLKRRISFTDTYAATPLRNSQNEIFLMQKQKQELLQSLYY